MEMSLKDKASRFWKRNRRALLVSTFGGWALLILALHRWSDAGARTIKGATELLDIGALPVT